MPGWEDVWLASQTSCDWEVHIPINLSWLEGHPTALILRTHTHHTKLLISSHTIPIMNVNSPVHMVTRLFDSMDLNALRTARSEAAVPQAFSSVSFDVDLETGFFPRQPLRALTGEFALWEQTLVQARSVVKLAADRGDEALAKLGEGEQWRQRVRSVSDESCHEWRSTYSRQCIVASP